MPLIHCHQNKWCHQGELEHRTPKTRYSRTSRKGFLKQMTQIERRQARIHRIREKLGVSYLPPEPIANDAASLNAHYHIGKSQNESKHIVLFVQNNRGDPAVKVC